MGDMRNIVVVEYDPAWVKKYEHEVEVLRDVFGELLIDIHHIGSTSIPGIHAKPIIDIMPVVKDVARVDDYNDALIALGYEPRGENGIAGRRYFSKGGAERRSHHIHAYQPGNPEIARHLDFRDYLRAHPERAAVYEQVKITAAAAHPHDIYGYMDMKNAIIQEIIAEAQAWRASTSDSE